MLIVERSLDYAGAFAHDLSFGYLLRELPNAQEQIEAAIKKFEAKVVENVQLTRNDDVWQLFKTYHCALASKGLEDEIRGFMQE